jgi:hypothetical protein
MRHVAILLAAMAGAAAGCSLVAPYPTAPAAPEAKAAADPGPRVAICYNSLQSTLDQIRAQAQGECAAGTTAVPVDTDYHLQNCPLLLPGRATFVCTPQK